MISTKVILVVAIAVFTLMVIGLVLTMLEFTEITEEPSQDKGGRYTPNAGGADSPHPAAKG